MSIQYQSNQYTNSKEKTLIALGNALKWYSERGVYKYKEWKCLLIIINIAGKHLVLITLRGKIIQ